MGEWSGREVSDRHDRGWQHQVHEHGQAVPPSCAEIFRPGARNNSVPCRWVLARAVCVCVCVCVWVCGCVCDEALWHQRPLL